MTAESFCYWLQGYFEVNDESKRNSSVLLSGQVDCIRRHLAMVFKHDIDPKLGDDAHREELQKIHDKSVSIGGFCGPVNKPPDPWSPNQTMMC